VLLPVFLVRGTDTWRHMAPLARVLSAWLQSLYSATLSRVSSCCWFLTSLRMHYLRFAAAVQPKAAASGKGEKGKEAADKDKAGPVPVVTIRPSSQLHQSSANVTDFCERGAGCFAGDFHAIHARAAGAAAEKRCDLACAIVS
jgi:hypothetical protein